MDRQNKFAPPKLLPCVITTASSTPSTAPHYGIYYCCSADCAEKQFLVLGGRIDSGSDFSGDERCAECNAFLCINREYFPLVRQGIDPLGAYILVARNADHLPIKARVFRSTTRAALYIQEMTGCSTEAAVHVANQHSKCLQGCMSAHYLLVAEVEALVKQRAENRDSELQGG